MNSFAIIAIIASIAAIAAIAAIGGFSIFKIPQSVTNFMAERRAFRRKRFSFKVT